MRIASEVTLRLLSFPVVQAQIASLQQHIGKLCVVEKDFEQAQASLERCRQMHTLDREQILRLEDELKAFTEKEKQLLLIQVLLP